MFSVVSSSAVPRTDEQVVPAEALLLTEWLALGVGARARQFQPMSSTAAPCCSSAVDCSGLLGRRLQKQFPMML